MYTLRAIVLSRQAIRDNQIRIVLFTREFGKITAWTKKLAAPTDIGSVVEILISRNKQENTLHTITSHLCPKIDGWNYRSTFEYLSLFQLVKESLPEGMEQRGVFDDLHEILEHLSKEAFYGVNENENLVQLFILLKARIMKKQGFLRKELFGENTTLPIIYNRLDIASMKSMISSKHIQKSDLEGIELAIFEGIHSYKNRI